MTMWSKIANVKSKYKDVGRKDPLKAAISDPSDERLDVLLNFANMALQMAGKQGKRQKQLARDTAQAIFHTCNGLVSLCHQLLINSHDYALLGQFSTDTLEKELVVILILVIVTIQMQVNLSHQLTRRLHLQWILL